MLTPDDIGPCTVLHGGHRRRGRRAHAGGAGATCGPAAISFHLAKHLLYTRFRDERGAAKQHLFGADPAPRAALARRGLSGRQGRADAARSPISELADKAAERIYIACQRGSTARSAIKAVLDPYNPKGSTRYVNFITSKATCWTDRAADRCHVSHVVCDSDWEAELRASLESHPARARLRQEPGPAVRGALSRRRDAADYVPDFLVRLDDGGDEPLNLVLEIKGYRGGDAKVKAETMRTLWVPGVNELGSFGRWAFAEFTDVYEIEAAFAKLIDGLSTKVPA